MEKQANAPLWSPDVAEVLALVGPVPEGWQVTQVICDNSVFSSPTRATVQVVYTRPEESGRRYFAELIMHPVLGAATARWNVQGKTDRSLWAALRGHLQARAEAADIERSDLHALSLTLPHYFE
jgi:hypothetical protein